MHRLLTHFYNWPISRKLSAVVLLTSGLLIGVMTVAVSMEKLFSFRAKLVSNSRVLAEVIGDNSTAALVFRDPDTAYEMLSALRAERDVLSAALYNEDGTLFVSYIQPQYGNSRAATTLPEKMVEKADTIVERFAEDYFDVIRTISLKEEIIGFIIVRTDLTRLDRRLLHFWLVISTFSALLLTGGMLLCIRLNRAVTAPVTELARTMQQITQTQNYQKRVEKIHDDEIGILVDVFNTMLAKIRKRESELELHQDHLEELVEIRTRELQDANSKLINEIKERREIQKKLGQAEKMEAIGTLAGGVAHDLNNILSGIVSYPDFLLLNLPQDSELRRPIETIRASGKKAAAIVTDLLTLARRGVKIEERVDMQELVTAYLASPEFRELLKTHPKTEVRFDCSNQHYWVKGSPIHLSKTVMNLVANGVEAMVDGGVLEITLASVTLNSRPAGFSTWRSGPYIKLAVVDSGVGIAEKELERIYEPFYSRKVMGKSGTGLGMAVVWGTVEDHGGHIIIDSLENVGTTFQLFFPADDTIDGNHTEKEEEGVLRGAGESVLLVDDSEEQRNIASDILHYLGYMVTTVASGEEAIEYLRRNSADLIILDMIMTPGIDGLQTYKRILEFKPYQKAIIASGYSNPANIEEARKLGVSAYVRKPYTVARIGEALREVLFPSAGKRS